MSRRFATPIDLQQLELLRPRLEQRTGNPTSGVEGQVYYDSTRDKIVVCTATGSPGTWTDVLLGPVTSADILDGTIANGDVSASAAIVLSKLAQNPLDRSLHTGSQIASTISDFNTAVRTNTLAQMAAPAAPVAFGGQKITGLADGTAGTDAVTKQQLDAVSAGLDVKASVRVATTAAITIASAPSSIDTIGMSNGDRVLVKNQAAGAENGIYVWNGTTNPLTRAADADSSAEVSAGLFTFVEDGSQADTGWVLSTNNPITLGTTALTFTQFNGAGSYTGGNGLTLSGSDFSVNVDGASLEINADALRVKAAGINLASHVTGSLPVANGGTAGTTQATARAGIKAPGYYDNGAVHASATTIAITAATHGLGTGRNKIIKVLEESTGDAIETDQAIASNGDVTVGFAVAPAANTHRVLIAGW